MTALEPTEVPVPASLARCEDPAVLGAPFYVMEKCPRPALPVRGRPRTARNVHKNALARADLRRQKERR